VADTDPAPHERGHRARFAAFVADVEPRLRRALVAAYGPDRGREAAAEALAYAWQHWEEVSTMANAAGYLYRVGQSRTRERKRPVVFPPRPEGDAAWVEPELLGSLQELTEAQRVAVVLVHAYGWTHPEVAEMTGSSPSSVQTHLDRGLAKLRRSLGVDVSLDGGAGGDR
jgi:DNA-directed RNA polymerase specialized sigma24 family protein